MTQWQLAVRHMGHGSDLFLDFFFTQNLLLMFLKILVQQFCVSMEMCSIGIEEVCS